MAIADHDSEVKIRQLCSVIRWKSKKMSKGPCQEAKNDIRISQSVDDISPTCTAKGRGLHCGTVGRGSKFSIQMGFETIYDLYIEIHGPNTEYCKEILTSIFRSKRMSIAQGKRAGGSVSKLDESGRCAKEIQGIKAPNKGNHRKIPLDYKCVSEGVFNITFVPNSVGEYLISIIFRGKHIKDSPFKNIVDKQINIAKGKVERPSVSFYRNQATGDDVNGDLTDGCDASISTQHSTTDLHGIGEHIRPKMSKQYTVTRRRILRRILTKGGKDVNFSSMSSSDDSYNFIKSVSGDMESSALSNIPTPTIKIDRNNDRSNIETKNKFAEQMANEVIDKVYESMSREKCNRALGDAIDENIPTNHASMACCPDVKNDTRNDNINNNSQVCVPLVSHTDADVNILVSKDSKVQEDKPETITSTVNQTLKHSVVRQMSNPRTRNAPPESPTLKILHSQSQKKSCYYNSQRAFTNSIEGLATPASDTKPMVVHNVGQKRLVRMTKSLPVSQEWTTGSLTNDKRLINEIFDDFDNESLHMPKWNSIENCKFSSNDDIYNDAFNIIDIKTRYNGVPKDFAYVGSKTSERRASLQRQEGVFLKVSEESSYDTDDCDSGINSSTIQRNDDGSVFETIVSSCSPDNEIPTMAKQVEAIIPRAKVNKCTQVSTNDIKEATGWRIGVGIARRREDSKEPSTAYCKSRADMCTYSFGISDNDTDHDALPTTVDIERHNKPEIPNIICEESDTRERQEANQLNNQYHGSIIDRDKEGYDVHGWLKEIQVDNNNALRPVRQSTVETTDSGIMDESNPPSPMRQRNDDDAATENRHRALCRGGYQGDISLHPEHSRYLVDENNDEDKENIPVMPNMALCPGESLTRKSGPNHTINSRLQASTDESFSYSDSDIRKVLQMEQRKKIQLRSRLSKRNGGIRQGRRFENRCNDDELFSTDRETINVASSRKLSLNKTGSYFGENTPFRKIRSARKSLGKTWSDDFVTSAKRKGVSFLCKSLSDNPSYADRDTTCSDYETESQEETFPKHIYESKVTSMNDETYFGFGLSATDRNGLLGQLNAFSQLHLEENDRVAEKGRRASAPCTSNDSECAKTTKRSKSEILVRMSTISKTLDQSSYTSDESNLPVMHNDNVKLLTHACDERSSQCSPESDGHHTLHSFENLLKHFEEADVAHDYSSDEQQWAISSLIDTDNTNFEATVLGNGVNYGTVGLHNSFQVSRKLTKYNTSRWVGTPLSYNFCIWSS